MRPTNFEEPKVKTCDFGLALIALKNGHKVSRIGWNGKGMYLYMVGSNRYKPTTRTGFQIAANHVDGLVPYRAYIAMFTVDKDVVPWTASQTDVLAEDWVVTEVEDYQ
jgi:hypothetical protein